MEPQAQPKKLNSRWRKGAQRYSDQRTIEHARWIRDKRKHWKLESDSPTEVKCVERAHEGHGWRNGARVRKP